MCTCSSGWHSWQEETAAEAAGMDRSEIREESTGSNVDPGFRQRSIRVTINKNRGKCHDQTYAPRRGRRSCRSCRDQGLRRVGLAFTHDHDHSWLRSRRTIRRRRPHYRRRACEGAQPVGHRRTPPGRLRHQRGGPDRARRSRWLHPRHHSIRTRHSGGNGTKLPYRSIDDFTTITLATEYPYVMVTNSASGIKSVAELISAAHSRSPPLLYGTPGAGSGPHLAIELFALQTKIKVQHIPFRGSEPAATELVAGRLDFMMNPPASLMGFIRSGKLNALAVSSAATISLCPRRRPLPKAAFLDSM